MFLHRVAAGLVMALGLGVLRVSVAYESWPLLALGMLAAAGGLGWLVFGGGPPSARRNDVPALTAR